MSPSKPDALLETLRQLEIELHLEETRRDSRRMEMLLHPEFEEFTRSGHRFSRHETLEEFTTGDTRLPTVVSDRFELTSLGDGLALLTYVSAHVDESGRLSRGTLRSSLWIRTPEGWQLRFHQGAPTCELPGASG